MSDLRDLRYLRDVQPLGECGVERDAPAPDELTRLRARVLELERDTAALDEQVRSLVRTEHRLTKARFQLDVQLARVQALSAFSLSSTSAEDVSAIVDRAIALLEALFVVDRVGVVSRSASGEVVRGPGIAPFALSAQMRGGLEAETGPRVGTVAELPWARALLTAGQPGEPVTSDTVFGVVPLLGEHGVRAIVLWRRPNPRASYLSEPPSSRDLPFFRLLASHIVHALRNARLTEELRRSTDELGKANLLLRQSLADVERAHEQLANASKLEAIGRLAGGVAHDFNNLLTVILANAELLNEDLPDDPTLREALVPILSAADKASQITRQLLVFSRKDAVKLLDVSLNRITEDMLEMLRRVLGELVTLRVSFDSHVGLVHADRSQLEQVIMNLVVNARDAMPRGGTLTIETRRATQSEVTRAGARLHPSCYVALVVEDTGSGMDQEVLARIFDPFFTTKPTDRGTGLGLSIVHGVVKKAEGHVLVESATGKGSRFTILLPEAGARQRTHFEAVREKPVTVLLVEDEDAIRAVARRVLARRGFRVLEASTGDEALAVARREGSVDLLITDVVMPQRSGVELAKTLRAEKLTGSVLFMSGYTFETLKVKEHHLGPDERFLQKPFLPSELLESVDDSLPVGTTAPSQVTTH